jgi:hypothetical protein
MGPSSQTARSTGSRTRPCISSLYVTSATTSGTARGRASAASELRSALSIAPQSISQRRNSVSWVHVQPLGADVTSQA